MDLNAIAQIIGSLGFPIVACGALFWQNNKQDERYENQISKITETVNNNTLAITKLVDKLEGSDKK